MSKKPMLYDGQFRVLYVTSQWPSRQDPAAAPFVKKEAEALCQAGIDVDVYIYSGGWNIAKYIHAIRRLRHQVKVREYDLVHARFGQCGLVGRAQLKLPVVITYGGSDVEGSPVFYGLNRYRNYILIGLSRLLSLLVDEVIVVSDHLGRKLPRQQYHVIPSGIDLDLFRPYDTHDARLQLDLPLSKKLVLFVGDPNKKTKRFALAKAACDTANSLVDLELVVLHNQPHDVVPWYMSACDVLILTSTNEGSPNAVKEALACNLPVVSVDVGDVRKRIGDVECCEVVRSDNSDMIAKALVRVLSLQERPQLRHLVAEVDKSVWASKVIQVYSQVLARKKNRESKLPQD